MVNRNQMVNDAKKKKKQVKDYTTVNLLYK